MSVNDRAGWELAELDGGPAHGLRIRVVGQATVLQVTYPCPVEPSRGESVSVHALFVYRRDARQEVRRDASSGADGGRPVRYGFDPASP
ncbi:hypothetical protein [Streptomyces sp. MBT27]|uniref:hypothetical protein n=1 Tax=Streptomyces sp. MBT27 TaxID=1488356 RepID=UPI001422B901|nr:hypothetical protein [Streptomyces sp. MBT27]